MRKSTETVTSRQRKGTAGECSPDLSEVERSVNPLPVPPARSASSTVPGGVSCAATDVVRRLLDADEMVLYIVVGSEGGVSFKVRVSGWISQVAHPILHFLVGVPGPSAQPALFRRGSSAAS